MAFRRTPWLAGLAVNGLAQGMFRLADSGLGIHMLAADLRTTSADSQALVLLVAIERVDR